MKILSYRYLPLNIYFIYAMFVLLSLLLGPIVYKDIEYFVVIPYVSGIVALSCLGYMFGVKGKLIPSFCDFGRSGCFSYCKIKWLVQSLLLFGVVSAIIQWYLFVLSGKGLSLNSIGSNYVDGYDGYVRGQASIDLFYILNIFDQAIIVLTLLVGLCYFKFLSGFGKIALIVVVVTYLLVNVIGAGKQKYLGDVVIFSIYAIAIRVAAAKVRIRASKLCLLSLFFMVLCFAFMEILRQRYVAAGIGLENINAKSHPLVLWDEESFVFELLGDEYGFALGVFLGYFSNGLYGLYLSLISPFEWSFFVGSSYSIGRIFEIILGENGAILERTYPYRVGVEYGWGVDKWHSLYSWIASDITFIGVMFLAPVFSFFYGRLWIEVLNFKNPFSPLLFVYISLGVVFSFSNNQLMHSLSGVIVFFVLFLGWLVYSDFLKKLVL